MCPSPPRRILFSSLVDLRYRNIALDCYVSILNRIAKSCVQNCFFSSSISTGVISLIWPSVPHSLKYLLPDPKHWQIPVLSFVFSLISGLQMGVEPISEDYCEDRGRERMLDFCQVLMSVDVRFSGVRSQ